MEDPVTSKEVTSNGLKPTQRSKTHTSAKGEKDRQTDRQTDRELIRSKPTH